MMVAYYDWQGLTSYQCSIVTLDLSGTIIQLRSANCSPKEQEKECRRVSIELDLLSNVWVWLTTKQTCSHSQLSAKLCSWKYCRTMCEEKKDKWKCVIGQHDQQILTYHQYVHNSDMWDTANIHVQTLGWGLANPEFGLLQFKLDSWNKSLGNN